MIYDKEIEKLGVRRNEAQEKYTYYITSVSVSAIGYSVFNLSDEVVTWHMLFLALSIFSFGGSVFLGLYFNRKKIIYLAQNIRFLSIKKQTDEGILIENEDDWNQKFAQSSYPDLKKIGKAFAWQEYIFYAGVILYLLWTIAKLFIAK